MKQLIVILFFLAATFSVKNVSAGGHGHGHGNHSDHHVPPPHHGHHHGHHGHHPHHPHHPHSDDVQTPAHHVQPTKLLAPGKTTQQTGNFKLSPASAVLSGNSIPKAPVRPTASMSWPAVPETPKTVRMPKTLSATLKH